jgi:FkbM family methyltransferase
MATVRTAVSESPFAIAGCRKGLGRVVNIARLIKRIANRFSPQRREIDRLLSMPRGTHATTDLIGPVFETLDGSSLASQYQQIIGEEAFLFRPDTPRPRILDCGANVGIFTVFCNRRFPEASITCFEPDPTVFAVLRRNVERCCATPTQVELVPAAVMGSDVATVTFYADHCDAGRTDVGMDGSEPMQVEAVRLRDRLDSTCDLLKLDIEGAEIDVLTDCADRLGNVANIFVEFHSFQGRPQRLDELIGVLTRAGFRLFLQASRMSKRPFIEREVFLGMDCQLDIWGVRE